MCSATLLLNPPGDSLGDNSSTSHICQRVCWIFQNFFDLS